MNTKVLTIVGARPQFIKSISVSRELAKRKKFTEYVIHTGQHYDELMSDIFFEGLDFKLNMKNLGIKNLSAASFIAEAMSKIEIEIELFKPDLILLYGDTNSTLSGALAGNKCGVDIIHVEGGVRNLDRSIPEEVNRIITDNLSKVIFYSTDDARKQMVDEGLDKIGIKLFKTDDLMSDALYDVLRQLETHDEYKRKYALITIHRGFNLEREALNEITLFLNEVSQQIDLLFPIHPNTKKCIEKFGFILSKNIKVIEPLSHVKLIKALRGSQFVITDSGGLQREAYMLKKKSLVILERSPWTELLATSCIELSNPRRDMLEKALQSLLQKEADFSKPFYGNGQASYQICDHLETLYVKN